jgi:hypothetical protein
MTEFPKLMFKAGTGQGHMLADKPLKIENKYLCDVQRIEDGAAEKAALEDGWKDTPAEACAKVEPTPEPAVLPIGAAATAAVAPPAKPEARAGEKQA